MKSENCIFLQQYSLMDNLESAKYTSYRRRFNIMEQYSEWCWILWYDKNKFHWPFDALCIVYLYESVPQVYNICLVWAAETGKSATMAEIVALINTNDIAPSDNAPNLSFDSQVYHMPCYKLENFKWYDRCIFMRWHCANCITWLGHFNRCTRPY